MIILNYLKIIKKNDMKYLLILSCLLFTSIGWSKDVSYDDLIKKDGLYYEKFTNVPFTGYVGGLYQGNMVKGKKEGGWIGYYENGQLFFKSNYKDDKKEGETIVYYENGQLLEKGIWKEGVLEGELLIYYETGQLEIKSNYKDGKKEGEWLYYHEEGQLMYSDIYKNGELIETIEP